MKMSLRNLIVSCMIGGGLLLAIGCTQHDDVIQSLEETTITLQASLLPELDSIYVYELWMVKVPNGGGDFTDPGADFTPLGKFTFDNEVHRFRDLTGAAISGSYDLPETWLAYDYIVVSIENRNDPFPGDPSGTFILADAVVHPETRPAKMVFPVSMDAATGFYFVGTPTNDSSYYDPALDTLLRINGQEGKGLWLCSRFLTQRNLHDTLAVIAIDTFMVPDSFDTAGWSDPDTIGINWPPDSVFIPQTVQVVFGYDTLQHRRIDIDWIVVVDSLFDYLLFPSFEIDSISTPMYPFPLGVIPYFEYSSPLEGLPDVSPYGWQYNAWVFLEQPDTGVTTDNTGMDLAELVRFGDGRQQDVTARDGWGVLPLGPFFFPDSADLMNEYLNNKEVPNFPGEDFVLDADPRFTNLNLRRIAPTDWGSVVVGVEPVASDSIQTSPDRNFPLMILFDMMHQGNAFDVNAVHEFHNYSSFLPVIWITVEFHE